MELKAVSNEALSAAYKSATSKPATVSIVQNRLVLVSSATEIRAYEIDGIVAAFRDHQKTDVTWDVLLPVVGGTINYSGVAYKPEFKTTEIKFYYTQLNNKDQK